MISSDIRRRPENGWPDEFGRSPLARAYARMLMEVPREQEPVVAAVFGTWGSGKTRFCRFVQEHIEETDPRTKVLWFEPWKYASRQDLGMALIYSLTREISADRSASDAAKTVAKRLGLSAARLLAKSALSSASKMTGLPIDQITEAVIKNIDQHNQELQSETNALIDGLQEALDRWSDGGRVYIIVDDLDRCLPEQAIDLMESLHILFAHAPCVFVLAVDRNALHAAIKSRYGSEMDDVGRVYVDKIVHVPFSLPQVSVEQLTWKYQDQLTELGINELQVSDLVQQGLGDNPRLFERFINAMTVVNTLAVNQQQELSGGVTVELYNNDLLVLLTLLSVKFPDFWAAYCLVPAGLLDEVLEAAKSQDLGDIDSLHWRGAGTLRPHISSDSGFARFAAHLDSYWFNRLQSTDMDQLRSFVAV